MKDIAFLISYLPLGRILRRLKSATSAGSVAVICWNRMLQDKIENKVQEGIEQIQIVEKSEEGKPLRAIFSMFLFAVKALKALKKLKPKIIHTELLNMLFIAVVYKCIFSWRVKIIYEVSDIHSILIDKQQSIIKKIISKMLFHLEKFMCHFVIKVIVTSEFFIDEYFQFFLDKEKLLFIPNSPEKGLFDCFKRKGEGKYTVGFIGYVRYKKQLEMLMDIAEKCDINVLIAGVGTDYQYLKDKYGGNPYIRFYGAYEYEKQIRQLYEMVDCVYAVYDADLKNVRVALPNKLYESIACGLPIIVAKNTKLADLVMNWGVGIEVSHQEANDLIEAINRLKKDKDFTTQIQKNCKLISDRINTAKTTQEYINLLKRESSSFS